MRTLLQVILVLALVGCASPYRTVYTSAEGDSYIEEIGQPAGYYYFYDSIMYAGIGFDPWWVIAYSPATYINYDAYYYLYYLSAWNPRIYQPWYGYFGYHGGGWCPPYRVRHGYLPVDGGEVADQGPETPGLPNPVIVDEREKWRTINMKGQHRMKRYGGDISHAGSSTYRSFAPSGKELPQTRTAPTFSGNRASDIPGLRSMSSPTDSGTPPGFTRSPMMSAPTSSRIGESGVTPARSKQ